MESEKEQGLGFTLAIQAMNATAALVIVAGRFGLHAMMLEFPAL